MKNLILCFQISLICFTISAQDKVGIGTTDPKAKLHITTSIENPQPALRVDILGEPKLRVNQNGGTALGASTGASTDGLFVNGNTGLGVANAEDKLAVDGDINLTGEIKANSINGQPGQLLSPDGTGGMQWINDAEFKNALGFSYKPFDQIFNVPANVTEIVFELWGAGGSGGIAAAGASGGYLKARMTVIPGSQYVISVGKGGPMASSGGVNGEDGDTTSITGPDINILEAYGGKNGSQGDVVSGFYWFQNGPASGYTFEGQLGDVREYIYETTPSGIVYVFSPMNGGNSPGVTFNTGGKGKRSRGDFINPIPM